jgi:hypothetical protein
MKLAKQHKTKKPIHDSKWIFSSLTINSICYLTYFYTIINYFSHHKSSTYHEKKDFRNLHRDLGYSILDLSFPLPFPTNDEPPGHVAS